MDRGKVIAIQNAMLNGSYGKLLGPNGQPLEQQIAVVEDSYFVEVRSQNGHVYSMPWPHKHMTTGGGLLQPTLAAAALWHFFKCAAHAIEQIPEQISLEGDDDATVDLTALASSIGICFNVTIQEIFADDNYRRGVLELSRVQGVIDRRILAFIESGGQVYRKYDREPN